jgi:predicted dinucleotide-binding enzyme
MSPDRDALVDLVKRKGDRAWPGAPGHHRRGNIGGNLTRRLTALGHDVSVANSRGPETLSDLAAETRAYPVPLSEIVSGAEIVIVSIPEKAVPGLPKDPFDHTAEGVAVIDTGNYYPQRDGRIDAIENGQTDSAWVAEQLGKPVVKVFNNIYAQHLLDRGVPAGTAGRIALPVAGDDQLAKEKVMQLVDALGFDPVDAGRLDESWRQQPGTPVSGTDLDVEGVREGLAAASPERPTELRG